MPRARLSETISVHASGRGNPTINLSDGRDVIASYSGPAALTQALQRDEAEPLALASADFDEDGVPDLICGYGQSNSGIITFLRGNVDSIYENSPEAQRRKAAGEFTGAPFLSPARVFALPIEAEFLGAGDFDGDRHWDIVAASRKSDALYLMSGDGSGGFREPRRIALPGAVTALVVGEINRRDGLDDVIVAINGMGGPKTLVFEWPRGALNADPEAFDLPAEASALALGRLDDDYKMDLAVAAGRELIIVHGRDRKLARDENSRADGPEARMSCWALPFTVRSMAIGDFNGNHRDDIALLSDDGAIHLRSRTRQEERSDNRIGGFREWSSDRLTSGKWPQAVHLICARVSGSASDDLLLVDSSSRQLHVVIGKHRDTGTESPILAGILQREAAAVSLDVEGEPAAVLSMRLNADSRRSLIVLSRTHGSPSVLLPQASMTFTVTTTEDNGNDASPTPQSLRAAIISANANPGTDAIRFDIPGPGVHTIAPLSKLPTITSPVVMDGTTQPGFAGSPVIELNGTNTSACPGFQIEVASNTVRGLAINRFPQDGIVLAADVSCRSGGHNVIEGNFIGTDVKGAAALGNDFTGVGIYRCADNNLVGGTTASGRNIISGNHNFGMLLSDGTTGNQVQGNFIGPDVTGAVKIGNIGAGVAVAFGASHNTIGGAEIGARNLISGNVFNGVALFNDETTDTEILNNYVGTDVTGALPLGNGSVGVLFSKAGSTIIKDNVISSNGIHGVSLGGFGNDPKTGKPLFGGTGATVTGNFIGTGFDGTHPLGNGQDGIFVENKSFVHMIERNIIAFNSRNGVSLPNTPSSTAIPEGPAFEILISQNSMFANAELGIDLAETGVTDNDNQDVDGGANTTQNFPVLTSSTTDSSSTTVQGSINSTPGQEFIIEFFSNPGDPTNGALHTSAFGPCIPQGKNFIGSITVTTDSKGNASISFTSPVAMPGSFINATATNFTNNTSEFSACVQPRITGADLSIEESAVASVLAGKTLSYEVKVVNNGPSLATNIVMTSSTPEHTAFQSLGAPAGWTSRLPDVGKTGAILCSTTALQPGSAATFTLVVEVSADTANGEKITHSISVSSAIADPNSGNNSVSLTTNVGLPDQQPTTEARLSLALQGSADSVLAGEVIAYSVTVTNGGPDPAQDAVLRLDVPINTTLKSIGDVSGWTHQGPPAGETGKISYKNPSFLSGQPATFKVEMKVNPNTEAGTEITVEASVSSATADPKTDDNSRTVKTRIRPKPPGITSITVGSSITIVGSRFAVPLELLIDDGERAVGFFQAPKVKSSRVVQKGRLEDGRTILEAIPRGKLVTIKLINGDGGEIEVSFRN